MNYINLIGKIYKVGEDGDYFKVLNIIESKSSNQFFIDRKHLLTNKITHIIVDKLILDAITKHHIIDNNSLIGALYNE